MEEFLIVSQVTHLDAPPPHTPKSDKTSCTQVLPFISIDLFIYFITLLLSKYFKFILSPETRIKNSNTGHKYFMSRAAFIPRLRWNNSYPVGFSMSVTSWSMSVGISPSLLQLYIDKNSTNKYIFNNYII